MTADPSAVPTVWAAWAMLEAAVRDPSADAGDRAVARAMLAAGQSATLPLIPRAVMHLAATAADAAAGDAARQSAWRALAEEARAHRAQGCRLGQWAGALAIAGGKAERGLA